MATKGTQGRSGPGRGGRSVRFQVSDQDTEVKIPIDVAVGTGKINLGLEGLRKRSDRYQPPTWTVEGGGFHDKVNRDKLKHAGYVVTSVDKTGEFAFASRLEGNETKRVRLKVLKTFVIEEADSPPGVLVEYSSDKENVRDAIERAATRVGEEIDKQTMTTIKENMGKIVANALSDQGLDVEAMQKSLDESVSKLEKFNSRSTDVLDRAKEMNARLRQKLSGISGNNNG